MTQQHCHQHDSASRSCRGQVAPAASSPAWLGSIVAGMTQHLHRVMAKSSQQRRLQHDSAALSPAWLDIYITPRLSHLDSVVASMTWQHCRQHDSHLQQTVAKSPRQHRRQYDSASTSRRGQVALATPSLAWLVSIVSSITRHLHRAMDKSSR
jgi:hypothetical protein